MPIGAAGTLAHIDVHNAVLSRPELIDVECWSNLDAPVNGLEAGIAVEEVEGEPHRLLYKRLPKPAKKLAAAGIGRRDAAGDKQPARIHSGVAHGSEIKERVLPDDGFIAFDAVGIEWIPPVSADIREFTRTSSASIPRRH